MSLSLPANLQATKTLTSIQLLPAGAGSGARGGGMKMRLWYKAVRVTRYVMENVSGEQTSGRMLLDHAASPKFGGFAIITKERCVKASAGVSRFEFCPAACRADAEL